MQLGFWEQEPANDASTRTAPVIYFIEAVGSGLVKIGWTRDLACRLRQLRTAQPLELRVLRTIAGGSKEERALHRRLDEHRDHDEWFRIEPIRVLIAQLPAVATPERSCVGCGALRSKGSQGRCRQCFYDRAKANHARCMGCSKRLNDRRGKRCRSCDSAHRAAEADARRPRCACGVKLARNRHVQCRRCQWIDMRSSQQRGSAQLGLGV